ncbi:MAG TPA: sialidase family protein [Anaerolineae bacterium]
MTLPACASVAVVDTTEDEKAIGYPDSRKIVRDSQGNLYAAYRKKYRMFKVPTYHIFVARSSNGGSTWTVLNANIPVETTGDYNQRVPSIAIDGNDTIHVAWYGDDESSSDTNERQIKYVRSSDGGATWSPWRNLADVAGYRDGELWQEHPLIYAASDGILYVVWEGQDREHQGGAQTKFIKSIDAGSEWTPWINVSPSNRTNYSRPTVISSKDGSALYILAYSAVENVQQIVWTQSNDGGLTWSPWQQVAPDSNDQRHLSLVIDSEDQLHVVWRQRLAGSPVASTQIHYSMYDGRVWSKVALIGPSVSHYQFFPTIAITGANQLWVAWSETTSASGFPKEQPSGGDIYSVFNDGSGWSSRIQLTNNGQALYPTLRREVYGNSNRIDILWLENGRGPNNKIFYQTFLAEMAIASISNSDLAKQNQTVNER